MSASAFPPDFPQSHEKQRGVSPSSDLYVGIPTNRPGTSRRRRPGRVAGGGGRLAASSSSREEKHWAGGRFFPVKTGGKKRPGRRDSTTLTFPVSQFPTRPTRDPSELDRVCARKAALAAGACPLGTIASCLSELTPRVLLHRLRRYYSVKSRRVFPWKGSYFISSFCPRLNVSDALWAIIVCFSHPVDSN